MRNPFMKRKVMLDTNVLVDFTEKSLSDSKLI